MKRVFLAMYDAGGEASAALWQGLRTHLLAAGLGGLPEELTTAGDDYESVWLDPDLLLGQACGYPLCRTLKGRVRYVGTPSYSVAGTSGADYASAVVVRKNDPATSLGQLRGRRAAFNGRDSQSGYNAFRDLVAPLARDGRFFGDVVETGGHALSLRAVIDGDADVAAIDPVTLALQPRPVAEATRVLCWTGSAPGLPFITSNTTSLEDVVRLREGIAAALSDPYMRRVYARLHLAGFRVLPLSAYDRVLAMERRALTLNYPELA